MKDQDRTACVMTIRVKDLPTPREGSGKALCTCCKEEVWVGPEMPDRIYNEHPDITEVFFCCPYCIDKTKERDEDIGKGDITFKDAKIVAAGIIAVQDYNNKINNAHNN